MQFDYDEVENMKFVGMKRPIILKDELAAKHKQQNMSKSPFMTVPVPELPIAADPSVVHYEEEDGILFIDVQTGKQCFQFQSYIKGLTIFYFI